MSLFLSLVLFVQYFIIFRRAFAQQRLHDPPEGHPLEGHHWNGSSEWVFIIPLFVICYFGKPKCADEKLLL